MPKTVLKLIKFDPKKRSDILYDFKKLFVSIDNNFEGVIHVEQIPSSDNHKVILNNPNSVTNSVTREFLLMSSVVEYIESLHGEIYYIEEIS